MSRILVVDNNRVDHEELIAFLRQDGHAVDIAKDKTAACDKVLHNDYDIYLTGAIHPGKDGMELFQMLCSRSESAKVVVMAESQDAAAVPVAEKIVLQSATQSIISLLSSVVETRDPFTAGHQRRVGNLSAMIAAKMGLDSDTVDLVRIIGYIHDIGKIAIPAEILFKPGDLSWIEMAMIRNHPQTGYDLLEKVGLPEIIGKAICQHHERCDGSGYPNQLMQDEITIEAQIIMVADVIEAMVFPRIYHPPFELEVALDEINRHAGVLFNPSAVLACTELFRKDHYEIDEVTYQINFPIRIFFKSDPE